MNNNINVTITTEEKAELLSEPQQQSNQTVDIYAGDEDLKESLLPKAFSEFIAYKGKQLYDYNQLAEYADKEKNPNNARDHYIFALLLSSLSLFAVTTQILFMVYAPSPYRWISIGITVFNHLIAGVALFIITISEDDIWLNSIQGWTILCGGFCCGFPLSAFGTVVFPIFKKTRNSNHYDAHCLPVLCSIHLLMTIFQTFPHFILLLTMTLVYDFDLNTNPSNILNWMFLSSILSISSIAIIISSLFQQIGAFMFNCIWLWYDFGVVIFILFATLYDSNTFIIFCVDISVLLLLCLILIMMLIILLCAAVQEHEWGPAMLICVFGPILVLIVIPFIYIVSVLPLCLIDQYLCWNVFPYCIRIADDDEREQKFAWLQYVLYEWVTSGENKNEMYNRLCCTNMVIMDCDSKYRKEYYDLMKDIGINMRTSKQFAIVSGKQMTEQIYSNVAKISNPLELAELDEYEDTLHECFFKVFKTFLFCYFGNRFIHLLIPFVFAIYIGYKENWSVDNISFEIRFSFYGMMILFILCIIVVVYAWKSLYYYRLILPIREDANLKEIQIHITNCYGHVNLLRVLIDWCETMGGNMDIANIIFGYCGVENQRKLPFDSLIALRSE